MNPRELLQFARTQCLLAVVFSRTRGAETKAEDAFDASMKVFAHLKKAQREDAAVDLAEWHRWHALARMRSREPKKAIASAKERERLLVGALGAGHPEAMEATRVRTLWARNLGLGCGLPGAPAAIPRVVSIV